MSNNKVKDWVEFERLKELPLLEDLLFVGNPLQEKHAADGGTVVIIITQPWSSHAQTGFSRFPADFQSSRRSMVSACISRWGMLT